MQLHIAIFLDLETHKYEPAHFYQPLDLRKSTEIFDMNIHKVSMLYQSCYLPGYNQNQYKNTCC